MTQISLRMQTSRAFTFLPDPLELGAVKGEGPAKLGILEVPAVRSNGSQTGISEYTCRGASG